jgi:hypothetical protein
VNAPARASVGDNKRPLITAEQLVADFGHLETSIAAFEARGKQVPSVVEDDDDLGAITALVGDLRKERKRVNDIGETEKRPFLDGHKTTHNFFSLLIGRLVTLQDRVEAVGKRYLDKKDVEAKARQAEIERQAREETARKEREAAEAAKAGNAAAASVATEQARAADNRAEDAAAAQTAKPAERARTHTQAGTATLTEHWIFQIEAFAMIDLDALRPYIKQEHVEQAITRYVAINKGNRPLTGVKISKTTKMQTRN